MTNILLALRLIFAVLQQYLSSPGLRKKLFDKALSLPLNGLSLADASQEMPRERITVLSTWYLQLCVFLYKVTEYTPSPRMQAKQAVYSSTISRATACK